MERESKFLILALLIYLITGFAIEGYSFMTEPFPSGKGNPLLRSRNLIEFIFIMIVFVVFGVLCPIALLIGYPLFMIPYFAITYGLLYWFYKKSKIS